MELDIGQDDDGGLLLSKRGRLKQKMGKQPKQLSISTEDAHYALQHDRKLAKAILRIPLPIFYFCAFVGMLFSHIPTANMFEQGSAVFSTLASSGDDTITKASSIKFANVQSFGDVFDWLENTLAPSLFITNDYNDEPLPKDQWGRVATYNKVLGAVDYKVTRKSEHDCVTQSFLQELYPKCFDPDATTTNHTLISFDTNASTAATTLAALRADGHWLDFSTSELLITIVTYNGELQGYAVTELQLEFQQGGNIVTTASTTPAPSAPYQEVCAIVMDCVVGVCFIIALAAQILKIRRHWKDEHLVLVNVWTVVELVSSVLVVGFYCIWITIVLIMYEQSFRDNLAKLVQIDQDWSGDTEARQRLADVTDSLRQVARLTVALRLVATLTAFMLGMRVLKRFRFHPRLSILTRTFGNALHQFASFFWVFIVVFMTFSASGCLLFGDRVDEFSSLSSSMEACVNMLFGNFDSSTISDMYVPVGILYYWTYMVVVSLALLNMILAIVLDAYADVSSDTYKLRANVSLSRVIMNVEYAFFATCRDLCSWSWWGSRSRRQTKEKIRELAYIAGATGGLELPREATVFRGRIRPDILEAVTHGILQNHHEKQYEKSSGKDLKLTPSSLTAMFSCASLTEIEARATIEHLLNGLELGNDEADAMTTVRSTSRTNLIARLPSTEVASFRYMPPFRAPFGAESTVVTRSPTHTTIPPSAQLTAIREHDSQREQREEAILARLSMLEQKLDALLARAAR